MKVLDESILIQDAQNGDLESFNRLVVAYQDLVYSQAYHLLSEQESAEDATQDAFIAAFKHLKSFRGGSFKAWLLRIVTNTCYDFLRRQKRRPTQPLEPQNDDDEEIESPAWLADTTAGPEEKMVQAELRRALQHCLDGLPGEFKAAVVLVDIQGLDYEEAAVAMGKPLGTVKSRLARARFRMRDCLKDYWELLPLAIRQLGERI